MTLAVLRGKEKQTGYLSDHNVTHQSPSAVKYANTEGEEWRRYGRNTEEG